MASGWHNEPRRHALASKGVRTAQPKEAAMQKASMQKQSMYEIKKGVDGKDYKVVNETWYSEKTPDNIVTKLETHRLRGTRIRFHWGDKETGKDWGDTYDVEGRIGRSTGQIKIPLLINNSRSMGGGAILTDSIVKMRYANKKQGGIIYQHPNYHTE